MHVTVFQLGNAARHPVSVILTATSAQAWTPQPPCLSTPTAGGRHPSESSDSPPPCSSPRGGGGAVGDSAPPFVSAAALGCGLGLPCSVRSSRSRPSFVPYASPPPCSGLNEALQVWQTTSDAYRHWTQPQEQAQGEQL